MKVVVIGSLASVVLAAMLIVPGVVLAQEEDWLVNFTLTTDPHISSVPGSGYTFGFGAKDGAAEGYDAAEGDQVAPPDPMRNINAYFYYPDNPSLQRSLVTSVVGPAMTVTWPLLVKSVGGAADSEATLTWDASDVASLPAKYVTLELRDTAGNTLADIRTEDSYTFTLLSNETRDFYVVAAEAAAEIAGQTREVNCDILPNVTVTAYLDGVEIASTVSDGEGNYALAVPEFGEYEVVARKDGFRDRQQTIEVTGPTTAANFAGKHGLIPNQLGGLCFGACMSLHLFGAGDCALDGLAFAEVMSAHLNPTVVAQELAQAAFGWPVQTP